VSVMVSGQTVKYVLRRAKKIGGNVKSSEEILNQINLRLDQEAAKSKRTTNDVVINMSVGAIRELVELRHFILSDEYNQP